ncbi:SDR family NAD(P)-dependent oxidoreductase [Pseudomonas sp. NW5]|uniref:SDR family NAD(P)-dependent oxidoreductase n=1 Tax=Pseudomonas sp. NW5 TaxID=2934934 RepID=UPI00202060AC|nr:SDR family NAD(P)-dependent oxidoreductase [Pseudomonas sp. NW5]MCL7462967.1 SDR family NAD(P)-dependent oxidoreductase [Pseudomonas sp. NW5]
MQVRKELAVVVGATGAFGQAIVTRLCASGLEVLAVARHAEALEALAARQSGVRGCVADLATDASMAVIAAAVAARMPGASEGDRA